MRRIQKIVCGLGVLLLLVACGKDTEVNTPPEMEGNEIPLENHVQTPETNEAAEDAAQENTEELNELPSTETVEFAGLDALHISLSEEASISNSNLARFGYLAATDGRIFFAELEENRIYAADYDGNGRTVVCEEAGTCLQVEGEYLYYRSEQGGIRRVHTENLQTENLVEENVGEFVIKDGKMYVNALDGFSVYNLDGTGKEVLFEGYEPVMINSAGEDFLFIRTTGTDVSMYLKGYLVDYNLSSGELYTVAEKIWYPVLAGSYLSYMDTDTGFRQIYNTATGETTDLQIYAESAVSNGTDFYCVDKRAEHVYITRWNSESAEIFDEFTIDRTENDYLYLSSNYLYLLQQYVQDGVTCSDWSYYNLETGERGTL